MAMAKGFPAVSGAASQFDVRAGLGATVHSNKDGGPLVGVNPTPGSVAGLVTPTDNMSVNVAPFSGVVDKQGPVFIANMGNENVPLKAAPTSNSRIDVVFAHQWEKASPISDTEDGCHIRVVTGTPSPHPVTPDIPRGSISLAEIVIPAGAVSTKSKGVIIRQVYPFTAAAGGIVMARNRKELDWNQSPGPVAYTLDDGMLYSSLKGRPLGGYVNVPYAVCFTTVVNVQQGEFGFTAVRLNKIQPYLPPGGKDLLPVSVSAAESEMLGLCADVNNAGINVRGRKLAATGLTRFNIMLYIVPTITV